MSSDPITRASQLREQAIDVGMAQTPVASQSAPAPTPTAHLSAALAAPAFLPLNDRLLVRRLDPDSSARSGSQFIMPDALKEKPLICEVVAVSLGRLLDSGRLIPSLLAPGDRILVGKYSGTEVKLDGEDYLTLREEEVQGVVGGVDDVRIGDWLSEID